jgi:transposase-like protein
MPQELLPQFTATEEGEITDLLSFQKREGMIYYFHGSFPVFCHAERDRKTFRMFTSQLVVNGNCRQVDIIRAFGVSAISVKRAVKKYREGGTAAFYSPPRTRGASVLTPDVLKQAQELLSSGVKRAEVAKQLHVKSDTLSKAIRSGRLVEAKKKTKKTEAAKANEA